MNKRKKRILIRSIELIIVISIVLAVLATVVWGAVTLYKTLMGENTSDSETPYHSYNFESEAEDKWHLLLVNAQNPLTDDFAVTLAETENGHTVDERIKEPLESMLSAARADGIMPKITSSYRTFEEQQLLLDEKTEEYISDGMNEYEAAEKAKKWVALPKTSEHHTGLAVDISTADWDEQDAYTVWAWLEENCHKYGFILRYTEEKEHITGIIPEPWHFRYVGIEAATEIMSNGICLEEYLVQYPNASGDTAD